MHEQSQIDEMRAAIRGDRERAEQARQRSSENVRALITEPEPEAVAEPEPEAVAEPEPVASEPEPRRGLLRRLLGL